jgi:hypothetical protein
MAKHGQRRSIFSMENLLPEMVGMHLSQKSPGRIIYTFYSYGMHLKTISRIAEGTYTTCKWNILRESGPALRMKS